MADVHAQPSGDCAFCCEEYTAENYVEYRAEPNGAWHASPYCQGCTTNQLTAKWADYIKGFEHAASDCAAALRRFLQVPPPIGLRDPAAFVHCKGNSQRDEVVEFWFASDQQVHSAVLHGGMPDGPARDAYIAAQHESLAALEVAESTSGARAQLDAASAQ